MIDVNTIIPARNLVIVKMLNNEEYFEGVMTQDMSDSEDIAVRYGEVISIGPLATELEHCPGLQLGDVIAFTEFAGYYISTNGDDLYKAMRGYDIIGKFTGDMSNKENIVPTGDRILVEILDFTKSEDGIVLDSDDPRLVALEYGKVLKVNDSINKMGLKEGEVVAFMPHVGTFTRHYESEDSKALKIIVEHDILFKTV